MKIVKYPNSVLSKKCQEITEFDAELVSTLNEMYKVMYDGDGIGLAAPQVGISKRMIVVDIRSEEIPQIFKMINPKIIKKSPDMVESEEGCLSLPGIRSTILRYEWIEVTYIDENFKEQVIKAKDLLAICFQHEIDHLDGKLCIDRLKRNEKSKIIKEYNRKKMELENAQKMSE